MMKTSRLPAALITSCGILLAISAASPDCCGQAINVAFIADVVPPIDGDFNSAANWSDGFVPTANFKGYNVQDGLTARFFSGSTAVTYLTVGNTSFGRLEMTGGSLEVKDIADQFEVGESIGGEGEVILTGMSTLTADGGVIGTRSKGLLSVGPNAVVDLKEGTNTRDLRVGSYGPAFVPGGPPEPGLDGDGLVDVQGTLNADDSDRVSERRERRNSSLRWYGEPERCPEHVFLRRMRAPTPALLALRSSKVSIIGSSGTFNVGLDPTPDPDPMRPTGIFVPILRRRYLLLHGRCGGRDAHRRRRNVANLSGTAYIAGQNWSSISTHFLSRPTSTADVDRCHCHASLRRVWHGDLLGHTDGHRKLRLHNGNVFLDNFQNGAGAGTGSLAGSAVPEPSGLLMMTLALGLLLFSFSAGAKRQPARLWGYQWLKVRA